MPRGRPRIQLTDEEKKIRRREQKKLSMRKAREKLDNDARDEVRRKDRERYHKKKDSGKIKTIAQYSAREQRQIRKMWRNKSKKRRELVKQRKLVAALLEENTPPNSPSSSLSRASVGRAVVLRNKRALKIENMALRRMIKKRDLILQKYRMRLRRFKNKKVKNSAKNVTQKTVNNNKLKDLIHNFLVSDENSRLTAGKKETITRKKEKRQIRLLNDTLLNLYKVFIKKTEIQISYQTFRRHRPFWVLFPKASSRNTCLCAIHENMSHLVQALHSAKIISHNSADDVLKAMCCENSFKNIACLERTCKRCNANAISYDIFNENDTITYQRWVTKNVQVVIKGQEKMCKKTVKESVKTTKRNIVTLFKTNLKVYSQHVANSLHQYRSIQEIKNQLSPSEGLLHIDFSENYNCKYSAEIQSAHFGGSKDQVSLHTCVYYNTNSEPPDNYLQTTSLCTVSKNLRHDPVLICAHLKPVLDRIKVLSPNLQELHVLSDGPTTQYRNKSMFFLIPNYICKELNIDRIYWHYSETGHGKGAPDGVGGCIKRQCDNYVALGKDVSDYDGLMACINKNCTGIEVYGIDESIIGDIQETLDHSKMKPFKGTFKIHQLSWSRREPNIIHARRLSCLICAPHKICPHFEIGHIIIRSELGTAQESPSIFEIPEQDYPVYRNTSTPEISSGAVTPRTPMSNRSPQHVATPDASTVPNTPSPLVTPESRYSQRMRLPFRPRKRIIFSSDSSDSLDFVVHSPPAKRFNPNSPTYNDIAE